MQMMKNAMTSARNNSLDLPLCTSLLSWKHDAPPVVRMGNRVCECEPKNKTVYNFCIWCVPRMQTNGQKQPKCAKWVPIQPERHALTVQLTRSQKINKIQFGKQSYLQCKILGLYLIILGHKKIMVRQGQCCLTFFHHSHKIHHINISSSPRSQTNNAATGEMITVQVRM